MPPSPSLSIVPSGIVLSGEPDPCSQVGSSASESDPGLGPEKGPGRGRATSEATFSSSRKTTLAASTRERRASSYSSSSSSFQTEASHRPSTLSAGTSLSDLFMDDLEVVATLTAQTSFSGQEDLLRGVRLHRVMRGCGAIFANAKGSARTYELSQRVDKIQYFLSHNWSVSRWDKYLVLSYQFNFSLAFAVGLAASFAFGIGSVLHALPTLDVDDEHAIAPEQGFLCRLTVPPLIALVFFFGHEVPALFGVRGPYVFLDKVCIHQTDAALQKEAICRLGAFLRHSERMLSIYTSAYLGKLWTIFEIANFVTLRRMKYVEVVPVIFPRIVAVMMPICYFYHVCHLGMLLAPATVGNSKTFCIFVRYLAVCLASYAYLTVVRRWHTHRQEIRETLLAFQVKDCVCTVEADRPVVYEKIAALMRATRRVVRHAPLEDALEAFNLEVRSQMPEAFQHFLGASPMKYSHYMFLTVLLVIPQLADNVVAYAINSSSNRVLAGGANDIFWLVTGWPLLLRSMELLVAKMPNLPWCLEKVWIAAVVLIGAGPAIIVHKLLLLWADRSDGNDQQLAAFLAFVFVVSGLTIYFAVLRPWLKSTWPRPTSSVKTASTTTKSLPAADQPPGGSTTASSDEDELSSEEDSETCRLRTGCCH